MEYLDYMGYCNLNVLNACAINELVMLIHHPCESCVCCIVVFATIEEFPLFISSKDRLKALLKQ
jgi:hypothetical protein